MLLMMCLLSGSANSTNLLVMYEYLLKPVVKPISLNIHGLEEIWLKAFAGVRICVYALLA